MKKIIISICALSTLLCVATGFAQTPPGLRTHNTTVKTPAGWSKGNKCGWYRNGVCVKNKTKVKVRNYRANVNHPIKVKVKN